jgi:D-aminopeptidase
VLTCGWRVVCAHMWVEGIVRAHVWVESSVWVEGNLWSYVCGGWCVHVCVCGGGGGVVCVHV